ncbi:MAG: EAL domain-containing protein [Clostridiales bacterium]|nr:EAL domain-containing protein [Clostridiales bacterium]
MFTWNFQYISRARLSSTLKQLNLSAEQGDILIRIHTAIHLADEAVELARFVKELVPQAVIFGSSCAAIVNKGYFASNRCVISVSTMSDAKVRSEMIPIMDDFNGMPLPVDMLCGQIKKEFVEDNTKLILTFFPGQFKDANLFVDRCNDLFPSIPMTGGVASLPQSGPTATAADGFVFNEKGWSDRSILIAALSGDKLDSYSSFATGVQAIGEEVEITDAFKSSILSINGKSAVDVCQLGINGALGEHPEILYMFPYIYADEDGIPIQLQYKKEASLEQLFPKGDPSNMQEYSIREDVDTKAKREMLLAPYNIRPGKVIRRAFVHDGKIISDNRALFQRVENFVKAETVFGYISNIHTSGYLNCAKWELAPYENSNMCGCVTAGEIIYSNGRNRLGGGAFVVSVLGEKACTQEYNPYSFSHTEALSRDSRAMLNILIEIEGRLQENKDKEEADRIMAFVRECEKIILYSENEEIPNEAALSIDIKSKGYDRLCVITVLEQSEMERVFSQHLVDLTYKNYIRKCFDFANSRKYHMYMIDHWMIAIAVPSYRTTLSNFVHDMETLQKELFEYTEELISIVPIFSVLDGCNEDNYMTMYNSARMEMRAKNMQFSVNEASEENDIDEESIRERYHMVSVINYAINNDKIIPYFQGIHDNKEGGIHHYESLMRIEDENGKLYYPGSFLEVARSFGVLYDAISKIMIKKVFDRFRYVEEISVGINISYRDIKNKEVLELIYDNLSSVPYPENFVFEILESEDIDDYNELVGFVDRVHEFGGKVAIDDFGSGFSNLQHLLSIHADYLKIDGSIIRKCCDDSESEILLALISGWKTMSSFNISIIAEYVENEEIQNKIISYDVDYSQGYLFSKPAPDLME